MASPKKPLEQAHARFFNAFKEAQGDESKIKTIYGALQISFFAEVGPQGQRQQPNTYARAKVTRMKVDKSIWKWVSQVCTH